MGMVTWQVFLRQNSASTGIKKSNRAIVLSVGLGWTDVRLSSDQANDNRRDGHDDREDRDVLVETEGRGHIRNGGGVSFDPESANKSGQKSEQTQAG
jgi:hypothetical protein